MLMLSLTIFNYQYQSESHSHQILRAQKFYQLIRVFDAKANNVSDNNALVYRHCITNMIANVKINFGMMTTVT